jgi:hypothetical protein
MDQRASRLLIETVLNQSIKHPTGLYCHDEIYVFINESEFL